MLVLLMHLWKSTFFFSKRTEWEIEQQNVLGEGVAASFILLNLPPSRI